MVYAKRPFGGQKQVLKYLARYTHRVAISNRRLLTLADGRVTFRWKDYAHEDQQRCMTLQAVEFIRRFLLHVLPKGFVKIRHYGFMANRFRQVKHELCCRLLGVADPPIAAPASADRLAREQPSNGESEPPRRRCPHCREGYLRIVEQLWPQFGRPRSVLPVPVYQDTS